MRARDLGPAGLVVVLSLGHDEGVTGWLLFSGLGALALAVVVYLDRLRD